jgi:hypothetical protein
MRTKKLVERVLELKPETRDDDKLLMLYVWQMQGLHFSKGQLEAFKKASSPESIRRTRQKLQEEGLYLASPEVEEQRYQMYTETRNAIPTAPAAVSWLND